MIHSSMLLNVGTIKGSNCVPLNILNLFEKRHFSIIVLIFYFEILKITIVNGFSSSKDFSLKNPRLVRNLMFELSF